MLEYPRSERTWGCWESSVIFYVFKKKNCCWSQKGNTILGIMFRYWNKVKTIIPRISKLFFVFLTVLFTEAEAPIFWPPNAKSWLIGEDLDVGKDWRQKEKGLAEDEIDWIIDSMDMNLSKLQEIVEDRGAWHATVHGVTKSQTSLSDWTTTISNLIYSCSF